MPSEETDQTTLAVIADTNLFLECQPLDELPWSELGVDHVRIIVTRAAQRELDNHKKNRNGRTFKKALKAVQLLRTLVTDDVDELVIQKETPRVTLSLAPLLKPVGEIVDSLDLAVPDDVIVGCVPAYATQNPTESVVLLTHDSGPMATAKALNIEYKAIPDHWLLPPQNDPVARENIRLRDELKTLQRQEPDFSLVAIDKNGETIEGLEASIEVYEELSETEIEELIERLKTLHPRVTDYGSPETTPKPELPVSFAPFSVLTFEPADPKQVRDYNDRKYPEWIDKTRISLRRLHSELNRRTERPAIGFKAQNHGIRPAKGCLIQFDFNGPIFGCLPKSEGDDTDEAASEKPLRLPRPPTAPSGRWVSQERGARQAIDNLLSGLSHQDVARQIDRALYADQVTDHIGPLLPHMPKPHNPDGFYWKDVKPISPQDTVALTCDNWRHGIDPEFFDFVLYADGDDPHAEGAVTCEIHAENVSSPVKLTVPVSLHFVTVSTFDSAIELIERR
ncbi:PIN domain-containing protein [Parasphingopyxis sp.]|uniref:PIN domain-containing protein n=1 Tax=Parasphingopyxis sp. TaxID=1920299 RepID=UPI002638CEC5|nr:PIN domain-containing protein [Parasphingopyxis sp.]